jgi:hypothetical protein
MTPNEIQTPEISLLLLRMLLIGCPNTVAPDLKAKRTTHCCGSRDCRA